MGCWFRFRFRDGVGGRWFRFKGEVRGSLV